MSGQTRVWDRHGVINGILNGVELPRMVTAAQLFEDDFIHDIPAAIEREFSRREITGTIHPGMTVAVTAGSRGIADMALILKETVEQIKKLGAKPFIFPAMGSHGGATATGQKEILKDYGITEESMGVPIHSGMETVIIGKSADGKDVHIDKFAHEADGILVFGRIKPHSAFRNKYESGLLKMMAIGMGKQKGAESCHNEGWGKMAHNIECFADVVLAKEKILFGLGVTENAYDRICHVEAILPARIKEREAELLVKAKECMPCIYIPEFDVLIVDQIGKNFSGDGADPNITGTFGTPYVSGGPEFQRYVILDVSRESHGNIIGAGFADFSTQRLFDKIDFDESYPNCLTSTVPACSNIPMILKNDKTAIQAAIHCCIGIDKSKPRIVRIKNSAHVETIQISEALIEEAKKHPKMKVLGKAEFMAFDKEGNLEIGS